MVSPPKPPSPLYRAMYALQTPAVGYTGIGLVALTLLVTPKFQQAIVEAAEHPTLAGVLSVIGLVAGALLAWIGGAPLSAPEPSGQRDLQPPLSIASSPLSDAPKE